MTTFVNYTQIKHLLPDIWEAAVDFIQYSFVMPQTVRTFMDQTGFQSRDVSEYKEGAAPTLLAETDDMIPTLLDRQLLARLTPQEFGKMYFITDRRMESDDDVGIMADAASFLGYELGKYVEQALLGDFVNLTGGTVAGAGTTLAWADIYNARARLRANNVPGPYALVLHEYQWLDLASAANIVAITSANPMKFRNDIQSQYYLTSIGDMDIYITGLLSIDGSDDTVGALYNSNALALDMRRGIRIEPQRDASFRATELNGTIAFAHGTWRNSWGVQIKSDATAPGSAVSQTGTLAVYGSASSATPGTGTNNTYSFVVVNQGTTVLDSLVLTGTIAAKIGTWVSDNPTMGVWDSTAKTWTGFQLAPGQSASISLVYLTGATGSATFQLSYTSSTPTAGAASSTITVTST